MKRSLEAELFRCRRHLKKLLEAQELYKKEVERKARELDQAKRILQQTLDALEVGILVLDTEMRIVFVNRSLKELFNISGDVSGKFCWEALHKLDTPCAGEKCRIALEKSQRLEEELLFLKEGKKRVYLVRTYPWIFEGKTAGIIRSFIDITDRKIAEEYEILSGISMYMAHVVKNSITPIGGFVKRLAKDCQREENARIFAYLFESIFKLERSMFEYEAYVFIKRKMPYEIFDVSLVLKNLKNEILSEDFIKEFFLEHIRDKFKIEMELPAKSVLMLGNELIFTIAIKHMIATIISYGAEELDLDEVVLKIKAISNDVFIINFNFNYAFPKEVVEFIFEPWKASKGRGFDKWGFAICKEMVDYHSGSIKLTPDRSSCEIKIPLSHYHY